jgi:hypothetical protein
LLSNAVLLKLPAAPTLAMNSLDGVSHSGDANVITTQHDEIVTLIMPRSTTPNSLQSAQCEQFVVAIFGNQHPDAMGLRRS